jgi:hypothetical protein
MEPIEAAEQFAQIPKLQNVGQDMEVEVALIVQELGYLALAVTLAASYVAATRGRSRTSDRDLPEYR